MGKRGNGEGTIYQKKGRDLWGAAVTTTDGRRKYLYGKTRQEVAQKLNAALHARQRGRLITAQKQTLAKFLGQWLEEVVRPSVRPWTYRGYEVIVRLHILPSLGKVTLEGLTPQHVQKLLNARTQAGLSPKTVTYIRGVLRTALNQAEKWNLVSRNVAALVEVPRVERHEIQPLTPDDARRFLVAARGDRLEALYSVALTMGLRQGEALGLLWDDVDFEGATLHIRHQLQRLNGKLATVPLKTKRSRRSLAMPGSIVDGLRMHRVQQVEERLAAATWTDTGFVFTSPSGLPLDARTVLRYYHRLLDRAGLESRRFHDLRHSCATLLLVQGVAPRVVMEILGHSEIGLTMNTYSHVVPELQREAANRMGALLAQN